MLSSYPIEKVYNNTTALGTEGCAGQGEAVDGVLVAAAAELRREQDAVISTRQDANRSCTESKKCI